MTMNDVVIVGCGPTGMTLAALLGQQGRTVTVLERYESLYNLPRAAAFDDETMRTFQKLGVAEKMLPGTNVQSGYVWTNAAGEVLLDIEYDNPGRSGWPAQYMMYQPHVEQTLVELLASMPNVEIVRGATVTALRDADDHIEVTAVRGDGSSLQVAGRFVVGADGGNGFVRSHIGSTWDDYGFFENWLVCDFALQGEVETLPTFRQVCDPDGPIAIVNIGPGHHRFSFRLEPGQTREEVTEPGLPPAAPRRAHPDRELHVHVAHRAQLARGPRVPGRRCRPPDAPVPRAGHGLRHPGRSKPRVQARDGPRRSARRAARHLSGRA